MSPADTAEALRELTERADPSRLEGPPVEAFVQWVLTGAPVSTSALFAMRSLFDREAFSLDARPWAPSHHDAAMLLSERVDVELARRQRHAMDAFRDAA